MIRQFPPHAGLFWFDQWWSFMLFRNLPLTSGSITLGYLTRERRNRSGDEEMIVDVGGTRLREFQEDIN